MSAALALQNIDVSRRRIDYEIKVTLSGNYTATGDTIDFTGMTNPNNLPQAKLGKLPNRYQVTHLPAGYYAHLVPGAGLTNWKLKIYQTIAPNNAGASNVAFQELTDATAYTAQGATALTTADIRIRVSMPKSMGTNVW